MIDKNKFLRNLKNTIIIAPLMLLALSISLYATADNNLTINGDSTGNIYGYATGGSTIYSVDVFWEDDMIFVFDRGVVNSESGTLQSTFGTEGEITNDMVEKDATPGVARKWYGFNGVRNRIFVLNRSNAAITARYESSLNSENTALGTTDLELYDYNANNSQNGYLVQLATQDQYEGDELIVYAGDPRAEYLYDVADKTARFGNNTKLDNTNNIKTLYAAPGNGSMYANKIFLNVTGVPTESFPTQVVSSTLGRIGIITITFNKV